MSLKLGRNQPRWYLFVHFHNLLVLTPLLDDATKKTSASALLPFTYTARSSCWSLTTVKSPTAFDEKTPSRYSSIGWLDPVARIVIKAMGRVHQSNAGQISKSWIYQAKLSIFGTLLPLRCWILMIAPVISCDLIRYTVMYFITCRITWFSSVVVVVMPSAILDVPVELTGKLTFRNTLSIL